MADFNTRRIIDPLTLFDWCSAALKRCRRLMTVNQPSSEDEGKLNLNNSSTLIFSVPPPLKPCRPPTTFDAQNRRPSENKVIVPPQLKPCRPPTTFGALNRPSSEDVGNLTLNKSGTVPLKPCRPRTTVGALNRPSSENKMSTETVSLLSIGTLEKPAYHIAYFRVTTMESDELQWYKVHLIDPPNQREPLPAFSVPFVTLKRSTIVALGSTIYSIGGLDDERHELDDDLYLAAPSSRVHCIDTRTQKCKECPPMHTPRHAPQVQVVNGTIYVMGGMDHNYLYYRKEHHPIQLVEVYHPSWNEWRELKVTNHGEKSLQLLFNPTQNAIFNCRMVADPTTSQIHIATNCSPCYLYDTSTGILREVPNSKPLSEDFYLYCYQPHILSGTHLYSFDESRKCLVVYDRDTSFDRQDMTNTLFLTDDSADLSKILQANYDCGELFHSIRSEFRDDKSKLWFETHELLRIEEIYKKKLDTEKIIRPISSRCFDNDAVEDIVYVWDGLVLQEPYVGDASLVLWV